MFSFSAYSATYNVELISSWTPVGGEVIEADEVLEINSDEFIYMSSLKDRPFGFKFKISPLEGDLLKLDGHIFEMRNGEEFIFGSPIVQFRLGSNARIESENDKMGKLKLKIRVIDIIE